MRNYISLFAIRWIQHVYSGGVEIYSGPSTAVGADRDDLFTQVQSQDFFMMTSLGGDSTSDDFPNEPQQVYVCFDKETVLRMFQNVDHSGTSVAVYLWDAITVDPRLQIIRNTTKSPRKTGWTDSAGVKRDPPPSESPKREDLSGAQALLDNFIRICNNLIATFTARHDRAHARLVAQLLAEVLSGKAVVTDALAFLHKLFDV